MNTITTWYGKPITELSKAELIEVIEWQADQCDHKPIVKSLKIDRDEIKQAISDELTRQSNTPVDGFGSNLDFGSDDWYIEGIINADALADAVQTLKIETNTPYVIINGTRYVPT